MILSMNNMSSSSEGIDESNPKLGVKLLSGFASFFFFSTPTVYCFHPDFLFHPQFWSNWHPVTPSLEYFMVNLNQSCKTEHCVFIVCVFISQQVKHFQVSNTH
jgi:hypothetical protein